MNESNPPKSKSRWYQFSLKTLFIAMLVSCFGFAWIGVRLQRARENRERVAAVKDAVVAIEEVGGQVVSEYEELRAQTWLERQFDDPGDADDPVGVLQVTVASFRKTSATDADLRHLKEMTNLQALVLSDTKVTDAGLEHLKGLSDLRALVLSNTKVTGTGLEHINGLSNLLGLELSDTKVTDAGLEHLKGLANLYSLYLADTQITDAGLEHLKGLKSLHTLDLAVTNLKRNYERGVSRRKPLGESGSRGMRGGGY